MAAIKKKFRNKPFHWLMLAVVFNFSVVSPSLQAAGMDLDSPTIIAKGHEPSYINGKGYHIQVVVKDNRRVAKVVLHFREAGSSNKYVALPMVSMGRGVYAAIIPASITARSGVEYFVEAKDQAGNVTQAPYPTKPVFLTKVDDRVGVAESLPKGGPPVVVTNRLDKPVHATNLPDLGGAGSNASEAPKDTKSGAGKYVLWGLLGVAMIGALAGGGSGGGNGGGSDSGVGGSLTGSSSTSAGRIEVQW